ncbi:MAG: uridine kinase [Firmicutes bacterium]|nr:uridine kinase [Bacillota bacterium]
MFQKENITTITNAINTILEKNKVLIVAIEGNCGSGKSTLANLLGKFYNCNIFHMDNFFLSPEQKTKKRLQEIGGNIDYIRFKNEIIDNLIKNTGFKYRIYDCSIKKLTDYIYVNPKKLNIIEGVYSMHPTLEKFYDMRIFLHVDAKIQKQRILKRNGEQMAKRFLEEWIPMENKYFLNLNIKSKCDIVIDTSHKK